MIKILITLSMLVFVISFGCKKTEPAPDVYLNTVVEGTVYEKSTNKPLGSVAIAVAKEGIYGNRDYVIIQSSYTDSLGKYEIAKLIKDERNNYTYGVNAGPDAHHSGSGQEIILGDTNKVDLYLPKDSK